MFNTDVVPRVASLVSSVGQVRDRGPERDLLFHAIGSQADRPLEAAGRRAVAIVTRIPATALRSGSVIIEAVDGVDGRGRGHRFGSEDGAQQIQPRVSSPDDVAVQ
jgi:hypothetical protein